MAPRVSELNRSGRNRMKVCHQTSGRLRLRIWSMHQDRGVADRLESALRGQAGIVAVRANPACASLVVRYEVGTLDAPAIQARIRALLDSAASVMASPVRPVERSFQRWWSRARRGMADWKRIDVGRAWSLSRLPRRPGSARLAPRKTKAPILLCRLNLRLTCWMLRTSARGWWQELFSERRATPPARPSRRTWSMSPNG